MPIKLPQTAWQDSNRRPKADKSVQLPQTQWQDTNQRPVVDKPVQVVHTQWQQSDQPAATHPVQLPDSQWQDMGLLAPQVIQQFKGINLLDKFSVDPSYATRMSNLTGGSQFPGLQLRPGTVAVGTTLPARIMGLALWKETELHVISNGVWYRFTGGTWNSIATGLSTTAKPSFTNFQGNLPAISLFMVNGVDAPRYYDGATVQNMTGLPAGVNFSFIDQHDNRMYGATGNTVYHTAIRKQDWTTVDEAGSFVIETDNGETINGIKAGSRHLMIFKPSSFHELWGSGPLSYSVQTISTEIGLLNNNAIASVNGIPYWADSKSVYNYGGSIPRKDFALPIESYIKRINPAQRSKVCAGASGNTFYLSIPLDTAVEPDTLLEYDTVFQVWYVQKNHTPLMFADLDDTLHWGDTSGRVLKYTAATTDVGAAIPWEWVSPPIGSGAYSQRSQWYRMWYVVDVPAGSTMRIHLSAQAEGETWTLVKTVTGSNLQSGRVIFPLKTVATANWVRVRIEGTGPIKITELDYQRRELPMV